MRSLRFGSLASHRRRPHLIVRASSIMRPLSESNSGSSIHFTRTRVLSTSSPRADYNTTLSYKREIYSHLVHFQLAQFLTARLRAAAVNQSELDLPPTYTDPVVLL